MLCNSPAAVFVSIQPSTLSLVKQRGVYARIWIRQAAVHRAGAFLAASVERSAGMDTQHQCCIRTARIPLFQSQTLEVRDGAAICSKFHHWYSAQSNSVDQ